MEQLKVQAGRNDGLLRERDMLGNRIREYQVKMTDLESAKIEIENEKSRGNEISRNIESLRHELRNKDLQIMEL